MRMLIVLVGLAALADVAAGIPCCSPEDRTWCLKCDAPTEACCLAISEFERCTLGETCYHEILANGRVIRGCTRAKNCPADIDIPCTYDNRPCLDCQCFNAELNDTMPEKAISECRDPFYERKQFNAHCMGDPHCKTFDNIHYVLSGAGCSHVLVQSNCTNGLPEGSPVFQVSIEIDPLYPKRGWSVFAVEVIYLSEKLTIRRVPGGYTFNGVSGQFEPWPKVKNFGNVRVRYYSFWDIAFVIIPNESIRIFWDYGGGVSVWIPANRNNEVCGLAGNADNDPNNDLIIGPSDGGPDCPAVTPGSGPDNSPGAKIKPGKLFGFSWLNAKTDSARCVEDCNQQTPMFP